MLTLSSMENLIVECNLKAVPKSVALQLPPNLVQTYTYCLQYSKYPKPALCHMAPKLSRTVLLSILILKLPDC